MAFKRVEDLNDAGRHGAVIEARCTRCGRVRYMAPWCLARPRDPAKKRVPGNTPIWRVGRVLRCRGGHGIGVGCGGRGAETRAVLPEFLPPAPAGVPQIAWLNADEAERRRLIRAARG